MNSAFRQCFSFVACVGLSLSSLNVFAQQNHPVEPAFTAKILIVARDRNNHPVQDIKAEDLTIMDNGVPAKVIGLEPAEKIPLRVGILLLADHSSFKAQQQAAIRLLGTLRPGIDQAFVLTQATKGIPNPIPGAKQPVLPPQAWPSQRVDWSSDVQALIAFTDKLRWNMGVPETIRIADQMLALNPDQPFRRVLIEFRNPELEAMLYHFGQDLDAAQLEEIAAYQRLNATVYSFAVEDPFYASAAGSSPGDTMSGANAAYLAYTAGRSKIERLALMTGGRFFSGGDFKGKVPDIQKDLQDQFVVRFVPQPSTEQTPHTLEIRVNRKNVRVGSPARLYPPKPAAP